jgi:hypothetical protein
METSKHHTEAEIKQEASGNDPKPLPDSLKIMAAAAISLIGEGAWSTSLRKARTYFAKEGLLGWNITDENVLMDVVPMPKPYRGWGFRLTFAAIKGDKAYTIKLLFPHTELVK